MSTNSKMLNQMRISSDTYNRYARDVISIPRTSFDKKDENSLYLWLKDYSSNWIYCNINKDIQLLHDVFELLAFSIIEENAFIYNSLIKTNNDFYDFTFEFMDPSLEELLNIIYSIVENKNITSFVDKTFVYTILIDYIIAIAIFLYGDSEYVERHKDSLSELVIYEYTRIKFMNN